MTLIMDSDVSNDRQTLPAISEGLWFRACCLDAARTHFYVPRINSSSSIVAPDGLLAENIITSPPMSYTTSSTCTSRLLTVVVVVVVVFASCSSSSSTHCSSEYWPSWRVKAALVVAVHR